MATINSAYTERLYTNFNTINERNYSIQIYDRQWTGNVMGTFQTTDNGLILQYDSDGDEKFAPIVGSKLLINMMVEEGDTYILDFISDMLGLGANTYVEGDVMVLVREGGRYGEIVWFGEYLQDLDTLPDVDFPFPVQLTFTDGIGKLKEISFEASNVFTGGETYKYQGHMKFTYWIGQVLQHTKFFVNQQNPNGFWDNATDYMGFQTCVRWWNSDFYYLPNSTAVASDPLAQTKGTMKWTEKFDPAFNQTNFQNAYDVLEAICKCWGMRVIAWQGKWYFSQIFEMDAINLQTGTAQNIWNDPVDTPAYTYYVDGDVVYRHDSQGLNTWDRFNNEFYNISAPREKIQKLSGGKYKFLPILNEAKVNLIHDGFQNCFPGVYVGPTQLNFNLSANVFLGGPFTGSTTYKFRASIMLEGFGGSHAILSSGYNLNSYYGIVAVTAGTTNVYSATDCLACLSLNYATNTTSWVDSAPLFDPAAGTFTPFLMQGQGGPFPTATVANIPYKTFEFTGYSDQSVDYIIFPYDHYIHPVGVTNGYAASTGGPYGSSAIVALWNPVLGNTPNPPAWSTGVANTFRSSIAPLGEFSPTTNTIFKNTQTEDSHKLDWGDLFWGDGPEAWDDSALQVRTGFATYEFTDWTSDGDWLRRSHTSGSNPTSGSGYTFNGLLVAQMKQCQANVIKRANFKTVNSPEVTEYSGKPYFVNPVGTIKDIYLNPSDQTDPMLTYFFRRGKFNIALNQWEGEWIETSNGTLPGSSSSQKVAGGTNLKSGSQTTVGVTGGQSVPIYTDYFLFSSSEVILEDVAITSLAISDPDNQIFSQYSLKSGDTVYLTFNSGYIIPITLTADVTSESTSISFSSVTPVQDSGGVVKITVPIVQMMDQTNRKTQGEIAGFDVSATSLTKGGISIAGFLDSDTMSGASATTLPTSESVKAYVDTTGGLTNYARFTCTGTALSSATDGEGNAVVVPFDTEVGVGGNTIEAYGASGVTGISDSEYCFGFGGDPASGYFELLWNITSDTSVTNNRVLAGVKLQEGVNAGGTMAWTDVSGTHAYIYNRGNGNVREGSCSGGALQRLVVDSAIYHRIVIWKEAASVATTKVITVTNGCQIIIKQLNE